MNPDTLIRSCWDYEEKITQLKTKIRIAEDRLTSTTANYSGEPVSGGDSLDIRREAEARLADLQSQLQDTKAKQTASANRLREIIDKIDNYNQKTILELRYCDLKSWKDVARLTGYSEPSVYRMHGPALISFNRQCNKMNIR